jgi:DNA-binding CsgD family transcriptional regulator
MYSEGMINYERMKFFGHSVHMVEVRNARKTIAKSQEISRKSDM